MADPTNLDLARRSYGDGHADVAKCVPTETRSALRSDDRAAATAVGKALEVSIVVLYVALLAAVLYGGAVPEYRAVAGAEVADRTLTAAADRIEGSAVTIDRPAGTVTYVEREVHVDLPATIRGRSYQISVEGDETLVLDHPDGSVGGRTTIVFPRSVRAVEGSWRSEARTLILVRGGPGGLRIELTSEGER